MPQEPDTPAVSWQLRQLLDQNNVSAYQLAQKLRGKMHPDTVYTLARGKTERVSLDTLAQLLAGLEALTGKRYTVADLLAYQPEQQAS